LLIYATTREIRFSRVRSLIITGIVGLFPMTTFVSSYIQPDNLALTMVLLSCYLALRVRANPDSPRLLTLLGLALGALCVTKYHFYAAVLVVVLPMLVADQLAGKRRSIDWPRSLALVLVPSVALASVQAWITWGSSATLAQLSEPNMSFEAA